MQTLKKVAIVVLAGLTAAPLLASHAEAQDGGNAALFGGAAVGLLTGSAMANAGDGGVYQAGWDGGYGYQSYAPRYVYRPVYRPRYVYVEPAPQYQRWYRDPYRDNWRWRGHHRHHHWNGYGNGEDDGGGWGGDND